MKLPSAIRKLSAGDAATLLLLLLAVVRMAVYARAVRLSPNPDYAIVAEMAQAMASGADWPVFFYGQCYMGSLEPAISALFCRLLGPTPSAVVLGTVLPSLAALAVLAATARRLAGPWAAALSLLFASPGPVGWTFFAVSPRGGYGLAVLFAALGGHLAAAVPVFLPAAAGVRPRPRTAVFAAFGLLCGLALWNVWLALPALAAAGAVLLFRVRSRVLSPRVWLPAAAAALLGSAPWWIWNAAHGWRSLALGDSPLRPPGWKAAALSLGPRLARFAGFESASAFWRSPASWCLAAVLAAAAVSLFAARRRGRLRFAAFFALHAAAFGVAYARTSLGTLDGAVRYFSPLVPGVAVFCGTGAAALAAAAFRRRRAAGAALAAAAALCGTAFAVAEAGPCRARFRLEAEAGGGAAAFKRALDGAAEDGAVFFAPWPLHYLNWMPGRRFVATNPENGRNPLLIRALEASDGPGFLDDYAGAAGFVAATGGSARETSVGGRRLLAVEAPPPPASLLPPETAASAATSSGTDVRDLLFDDDLATFVTAVGPRGGSVVYEIVLAPDAPPVCGVRAVPAPGGAARRWRAESLDGPEPRLLAESRIADLFWSGPRVFQGGVDLRWELRWEPRPIRRIRLEFSDLGSRRSPRVADLRFLAPAPDAPRTADVAAVAAAVAEARRREPGLRVLADRWLSGKLGVPRAAGAETEVAGAAALDAWTEETARVDFTRPCLAVCGPGEAARSEDFLRRLGVSFERAEAGGAVLLRFGGLPEEAAPARVRFVAGSLVFGGPPVPPAR